MRLEYYPETDSLYARWYETTVGECVVHSLTVFQSDDSQHSATELDDDSTPETHATIRLAFDSEWALQHC